MRASRRGVGVVALILSCIFFGAPNHVFAGESEITQKSLLAWEGKYPLNENRDFFDDPDIAAIAKKNIPATMIKSLAKLQVNTPFQRSGDILYAHLCKAHDCTAAFADIYLDTRNRKIQMCMSEYDPNSKQNKDFWVGKTIRKLEDGSCAGDMKAFTAFRDPE